MYFSVVFDGLFSDAVSFSNFIVSNVGMVGDWKGFGRKLSWLGQDTLYIFVWRD
jgi:hypothetical protein